jgi:hypothetical protein
MDSSYTANAPSCANLFLEIFVIPLLLVLAALQVHHRSVPPFADPTIQTELARSGRNVYAFYNFLSFSRR